MKKVKTFNQEVEHFGRVLEAEIQKKECWARMKWPDWSHSVVNWRCSVPKRTGCRPSIASSVCWKGKPARRGWRNCWMWWLMNVWRSRIPIRMPNWSAWFFFLMNSVPWRSFTSWTIIVSITDRKKVCTKFYPPFWRLMSLFIGCWLSKRWVILCALLFLYFLPLHRNI